MDNSEYQDTDAIPLNGPLPSSHYLGDEVRVDSSLSYRVYYVRYDSALSYRVYLG